jgi:peptidyl-prolyl cis-trans isomerase B (cyclophilin B)
MSLGTGGPGYTIPAEIGLPHYKGTLAAARTPDAANPQKESSGSQFYIVQGIPVNKAMLDNIGAQKGIQYSPEQIAKYERLGGYPMLDMDYTVFGEVVEGLDVIDKIAAVQVGVANRPIQDVKMKIRVVKE